MRDAIALLITIALITVMFTLVGISATYLYETTKEVSTQKDLIQNNIFLKNLTNFLKGKSNDLNDTDSLNMILGFPMALESKKSGYFLQVELDSCAYAPNINWLVKGKKIDKYMENYLDRILTFYNVSDKILFLKIVEDTIDNDLEERYPQSECAYYDPVFRQSRIYNYDQFKKILHCYERITQDTSVEKIPWKELVAFDNDVVDFNNASERALAFMADMDSQSFTANDNLHAKLYYKDEELPFDQATKVRLKKFNLAYYSPKIIGVLSVVHQDRRTTTQFIYDLKKKRASNVEILTKYF